MIQKAEKIEVNGYIWFVQKFAEGVNLYDSDGDFVAEFESMEEVMRFIQ